MSEPTFPLRLYRWIVLLLAAYFTYYYVLSGDYSIFGGPLRKLTIWGLLMSLFAAGAMIASMERWTRRSHEITAMVAAVVNLMVVFLYWRLYFEDPALVHDGGKPDNWPHNLYLHLIGPGLQIFDALFIKRAFRAPLRAILPLCGFVATYILWGEIALQPLSDFPSGTVTSGLPYPFLNNMELSGRAVFYAQNFAIALALLGFLGFGEWIAFKLFGRAWADRHP